ncbi:helix-turn-helix domain-containing protein [Spirosoma utsteinense]|uniref:helix-turn-helix domain-containing protein n=1 Tax=Spirosoma utsteinense TaxID=2585773 RepID=UPI001648C4FE|nr:helix-turn-helix domain-containing protein [Spirosoma utsteinense]
MIRLYRLRRAGELLRAGRTVTETAYLVGFDSLTYFGHCYREHYQMTPTEFGSQLV